MNVVYRGRGGYVELDGKKYSIELVNNGSFCISFPDGNRHSKLQQHLEILTEFIEKEKPKWYIENNSKKYKIINKNLEEI